MTAPRVDRAALRRAAEAVGKVDGETFDYAIHANPAAVLALLDEADAADARLAAVEALCDHAWAAKDYAGLTAWVNVNTVRAVLDSPPRPDPTPSPAEEADDRRDQDDYDAREQRL